MEIYRRLVACKGSDDVRQLAADLADAYGPVPSTVEALLDLAEIRVLAGELGVQSIIRMGPDVIFRIGDHRAAEHLFDEAAGSVRLPDENTVHWRPPSQYLELPTLVVVLRNRLRRAFAAV